MSFVTSHEGWLEYMIYSRLGPFDKFVGRTSNWDLVASGQTLGRGSKKYTRVLEEDISIEDESGTTLNYVGFKPLHVPGDRSQRSFYISMTKRFRKNGGTPITVSFSYPMVDENESEREYEVVASTPELEVFEGDGVLDYPWPPQRDGPYYRRPRGFIGSFDYERYPCHPLINFTGWPCPYVSRTDRPTAKPTRRPTIRPVSKSPTKIAINPPTVKPVLQIGQAGNRTETDAPKLVSAGPKPEEIDSIEVEDEETNGVFICWNVPCRSGVCKVAILLMMCFACYNLYL